MLPLIQSSYFQNLINGFPDGVIIFNIDGVAYVANATALELLGMEERHVLGASWDELFAPWPDSAPLAASLQAARACPPQHAQRHPPIHALWTRPDGQTRHLSGTTSHIVEYDKLFGILLALTDVTHIFEMHHRERRMLEEHRALEQERARSLEHFSMAVAHQIRNPVMTIAGFSRMLLRKAEPGTSQCEQLQAILDGGVRLHEIVLAVNEFTALHVETLRPMLLAPCCQEAVAHVCQEFPDVIRWVVDFPEAPAVILGDPALLALALQALLRNAAEAVLRGNGPGTVRLRLWREAQRHVLDMEDTGPGLADADLPFLFDPFFTTKPVGVGMGLCKAQRIIREHKGTVTLENREDGPGARARVVLPPHDTTA